MSNTERDLPASEEWLGLALSSARIIGWEWLREQNRMLLTDSAAEILGLSPGETIDTPQRFVELIHPDDRSWVWRAIEKALAAGETYRFKFRMIRRSDAAPIWIESVGKGVRDADGQVSLARGVSIDITAREQAEQGRAEAELMSQLKDEFLARASHELRTPLAAMRMWIQVLRTGRLEDREAAIEAIDKSARAQSKLIEDLLDLARGLNGKLRITEEVVDLRVPIEEALGVLRPEAEAKSILLFLAVAGERAYVRGDAGRLQQVVANLVSNAVKFTPAGGRVEVLLQSAPSRALITVSDTGIGIDPGALEHVFAPFQQRESAGVPVHGGLGLGLAIARQIVEAHGGTLRAQSAGEGLGATFTVTLPRLREDEVPPTSSRIPLRAATRRPLEGLSVLLVEDHAPTRDGIARVLASFGAEVTAASSAAEAFDAICKAPPSVILSDIAMPEEDGCAFLRRVRAMGGEASRTPAVALTAHARPEDASRTLAAGFQLHLAKPVESRDLVDAIGRLAGRMGASRRRMRSR